MRTFGAKGDDDRCLICMIGFEGGRGMRSRASTAPTGGADSSETADGPAVRPDLGRREISLIAELSVLSVASCKIAVAWLLGRRDRVQARLLRGGVWDARRAEDGE